jgi:hypothetical protein
MNNRLPLVSLFAATAIVALFVGKNSANAQPGKPESKYQIAQRNITSAITNLEQFVHDSPTAKEVPVALVQLNSLRGIRATATAVIPVRLNGGIAYATADNSGVEWSVLNVSKQPDKTVVTLSLHNILDNGTSAFFAFDRNPLALIDNQGQYYSMLAVASALPAGVGKARQGGNADNSHYLWTLQGGQTIQLTVEFEALSAAATGGKVLYKDDNRSEPAVFSLLNPRQRQ